jgi:hypothetical protein
MIKKSIYVYNLLQIQNSEVNFYKFINKNKFN